MLWLVTDPRVGAALWPALRRLPRGAGVLFRHGDAPDRRALYEQVRRVARRRGLVLVPAGSPGAAIRRWRDGWYGPVTGRDASPARPELVEGLSCLPFARSKDKASTSSARAARGASHLVIAACHDLRELRRAERLGADAATLSPVFATRTHPGAAALGRVRFAALARATRLPLIALGGMTVERARDHRRWRAAGWAAIDGLSGRRGPRQKRKAVPR